MKTSFLAPRFLTIPAILTLTFCPLAATNAVEKGAHLTELDRSFINEAYRGGIGEVKVGGLAKNRASSPEAKKLAERLVRDHEKADAELRKLAKAKGVTLVQTSAPEAQEAFNTLEKQEGAKFDKTFATDAVKDHQKDISTFERVGRETKDEDLKAFIKSTLPVLREHLSLAKSAEAAGK